MKKIYVYILILLCGIMVFPGCSSDIDDGQQPGKETPGEEEEPEELRGSIYLSSTAETTSFTTRAAEGFPNNGSIGVIAAQYTGGAVNWTSYPDINNTPATATSVSGGIYTYSWPNNNIKYWPFDNSQLVFMAYSPHTDNIGNIFLDATRTYLGIGLTQNMQDVLYASSNETAATTPYNKVSKRVNLGQFKHALSQLTVKVVADPTMDPSIRIGSLRVSTPYSTAQLYLPGGDNGLYVADQAAQDFVYTLISTGTVFGTQGITKTVLLFPGTQDYTKISIDLISTDNTLTTSRSYMVSYFHDDVDPNIPLALERGENTILTITVKGQSVDTTDIELTGTLSPWNYKGDFGITIK